jgi:integrase
MTLRQLVETYIERYVRVERASREQAFRWQLNMICLTVLHYPTGGHAALGDWRVADIVTDTIERFRETRRAEGTGATGTNQYLGALRAVFNWALRVGYVECSPFKRGSEPVVRLSPEAKRSRRLDADTDEEDKLLAACAPHLRAVVECALETGMRRGEILSLQWSQVEGMKLAAQPDGSTTITWAPRAEIVLPWTKTKTRRDRRMPISSRLRSILEMRRFDPAGRPLDADGYVRDRAWTSREGHQARVDDGRAEVSRATGRP